jgi:hypothetical protein
MEKPVSDRAHMPTVWFVVALLGILAAVLVYTVMTDSPSAPVQIMMKHEYTGLTAYESGEKRRNLGTIIGVVVEGNTITSVAIKHRWFHKKIRPVNIALVKRIDGKKREVFPNGKPWATVDITLEDFLEIPRVSRKEVK